MKRALACLFLLATLAAPAWAVSPSEQLKDPAKEARARDISAELRCLVCQNQSIDDSDADLAKDLRRIVRERIAAGDSNQGVKDYLVARYGEFVLLKPSYSLRNALLWLLPFAVLIAGFFATRRLFRTTPVQAEVAAPDLSDAETRALERLTGGDKTAG